MCPRSSSPFYIGSYYINWVTTSRTYSKGENGLEKNMLKIINAPELLFRIKGEDGGLSELLGMYIYSTDFFILFIEIYCMQKLHFLSYTAITKDIL